MKIVIAYPLFPNVRGTPLLSQNRQYQVFSEKTVIYPIVPAQAATLLKKAGYDVLWLDGIAEGISYDRFIEIIKKEKPDLIAFETKTPVIKQHWKIINDLKNNLQSPNSKLQTVLFGDHVTALPEESLQNSDVDFILTGGDYDFLLLNLCDVLNKLQTTNCPGLPVTKARAGKLQTDKLESGIWYHENGEIKNTGRFKLDHNLDSLPFIDRDLTKWKLYAYKNGNYKRTPGTYIMSSRDCWWGRCTFCSWPQLYPRFRTRSVNNVLDEIGMLIDKYQIREIMDDTGTFPAGDWLKEFCQGMIKQGFNKKIHPVRASKSSNGVYLDCNMRFGCLNREDFKLMKKANFRLLLFGLESANQKTLDRLHKNLKVEDIIKDCKLARAEGLYPHITIMFGYPWEDYDDAKNTLNLGRWLLKKGYAYTVQATLVIPYPGTALFEECKQNTLLKTLDWDRFDMKEPAMKTPIEDNLLNKLVQGIYSVALNPEFIYNRIRSLVDLDDMKYFLRAGKKVLGHLADFNNKN